MSILREVRRFMEGTQRDIERKLRMCAILLQAEHKKDLSKTYPPASRPGQYPAARTLNLRDSVTWVRISSTEYHVGYSAVAQYMIYLADRNRKTIEDTLARIEPQIQVILNG